MLRKLIERPIAVTMVLIMVVVLGLVSLRLLPISLIPSVDIPYITVQASYPQQSARELEEAVVGPLRESLMQIAGLKDIHSETKDGSGTISLSFEHGSKSDYLFIEVNEKIDRQMRNLPRDMERPQVLKSGAADIPAFYINITAVGDEDYAATDDLFPVSDKFAQLSDFAGNVIVKRIEQLPEVAMVDVNGYVSQEILVIPDQAKLAQTGLPVSALERAVTETNISLGNLTIRDGEYQFNVKVQRDAQSIEDVENAYLKIAGRIFQIKDLARVVEHPRRLSTVVRSDGKNAISLAVIKQSDARMSRLKKGIDELLGHFAEDYPDVEFTVTRDQTELLEYSINNLFQNIVLGILLACAIIFLFMRNLRSAFMIALTMPIALILSMLFFYLIGISINIISLSGLVLGVGMMVDNSIIVIDNITFRWESGYKLKDAIVKGTGEVFAPMLSSVLTTCAVFVPLIFLSGIAGALFYDQAMAVVITLFCALAATVTVIPVYFFLMFRKKERPTTNRFIAKYFSFGWFERWYERTLKFLFRRRWIVWTSFFVAVAGTVVLFGVIEKERLPEMTYRDMMVNVDWNERVTIVENDRRVRELVEAIGPMAGQVTEMTGVQQFLLSHTRKTSNSESVIYVDCAEGSTVEDVRNTVDEFMRECYPNAIFGFASSGNIFEEVFADREARLVARLRQTDGQAPDPVKLEAMLDTIAAGLPGVEVPPVPWEEYLLFVGKPDVMALYDVTFNELSAVLRSSLNDNTIFTIMQGRFPVPVVVGENRTTLKEIMEGASVRRANLDIPIGTFFRESKGQDLKYITSGSEGNVYPLELDLSDRDIPKTVGKIREIVRDNHDFEVSFSGSYYSNRGMAWEIVAVLLVAVLLLYFILAAQFESAVQPLVILSELVLDIFFTLVVLWIVGVSLNIMSLIGIVVTCGIVINDSILKVDTINQLRKYEGMSTIRAIMEGGRRRLKPIVMTSLTTMLAIAPFLVRGDMGSDLQYPLSVATIAGMTAGTLVSIFFVPLIYYSIYNGRRRKA